VKIDFPSTAMTRRSNRLLFRTQATNTANNYELRQCRLRLVAHNMAAGTLAMESKRKQCHRHLMYKRKSESV